MNFAYLHSRIHSLKRKLALAVAEATLRPVCEKYCQRWERAAAELEVQKAPGAPPNPWVKIYPIPDSHAFIRQVVDAGYLLPTFSAVDRYLERCRDEEKVPEVDALLRALLPREVPYNP